MLWAYANEVAPWLSFSADPWILLAVLLAVPVIHELHFFIIHLALHTPFSINMSIACITIR